MKTYIDVTPEAGKAFYLEFRDKGPVVMLNLLKFKDVADYSDHAQLKPQHAISGLEAYQLYMEHVSPEIEKAGSKIVFQGSCSHFLIGPESEKWDHMLLVEHVSVDQFLQFAQNENYLQYLGHRTAALEDSRLLPIFRNASDI